MHLLVSARARYGAIIFFKLPAQYPNLAPDPFGIGLAHADVGQLGAGIGALRLRQWISSGVICEIRASQQRRQRAKDGGVLSSYSWS